MKRIILIASLIFFVPFSFGWCLQNNTTDIQKLNGFALGGVCGSVSDIPPNGGNCATLPAWCSASNNDPIWVTGSETSTTNPMQIPCGAGIITNLGKGIVTVTGSGGNYNCTQSSP